VEIVVEPEAAGTIENTAEVRSGSIRIDRDTEQTEVGERDTDPDPDPDPDPSEDTLDCDDFSSQAEAQAKLDEDEDDPHNLDPDGDGIACENFNYNVGAAETTNGESTADDLNTTVNEAIEDATASNANEVDRSADAFRCDFFLHVVRDDRGGLRDQYRDDELIVRRFEQCLSEDVLAQTIPRRKLPATGGPHLLGLAALALVSVVAGASVFRAGTRRRR
jgi:hypothetical protein